MKTSAPRFGGGMPPVNYDLVKLAGGVDQITPTLSLKPGVARRASNFECNVTGGYTRIAGYERFDGRYSPNDAEYALIRGVFTGTVAIGDTLTGSVSGSSAKVISVLTGAIIVTRMTGAYVVGDVLTKSSSGLMTVTEVTVADNAAQDAAYQLLAADEYRNTIAAVPGSGPVRGVVYYNDKVYAWRDNAAGTELKLYKSSNLGWALVPFGFKVSFTNGSVKPAVGDVFNGVTSLASATIKHVILLDGGWETGDASGYITIIGYSGTFSSNEQLAKGGLTFATMTGIPTAVTYLPGGRVRTTIATFKGYRETPNVYGCDGVNPGFELYDNDVFVPMTTGMPSDKPTNVIAHKNHLFLAFGESLLHSAPGSPHNFDPVAGAGEIAVSAPITEMIVLPGDQSTGAMGVFTRNDTYVLYGTGSDNWNFTQFNVGTGAIACTGQNMNDTYVLDDRGVLAMATSLNYGNFETATLTFELRPFMQARRSLVTDSCLNREKSQYRVFFSDGSGLYLTIVNGQKVGAMPVSFPNPVICMCDGEKPDGSETAFFGSTNGFVYRLDVGGSFDGYDIASSIDLVYNSIGSPRVLKRFRKASVEVTGDSYVEFEFGYNIGYTSPYIRQPIGELTSATLENAVQPNNLTATYGTADSDLRDAYWDAFQWDHFTWDRGEYTPSEFSLNGTAENISIRISSVSNLYRPFTVNTVILHYTPRRGIR